MPHQIDIRFLLDTYIGNNDGVPFTIPGQTGLCDDQKEFSKDEIPDFIQALEKDNLKSPGTVAHLKLKLGDREPPSRVTLGAWPINYLNAQGKASGALGPNTMWAVPVVSMKMPWPYDSAVVIYWERKEPVRPNGKREVGFAYGLGNVASGNRLLVSLDGSFKPGGEFTVTALVHNPAADEELTLTLPSGFKPRSDLRQKVPPLPPGASSRNSPVTWKILAAAAGKYEIKVRSNKKDEQTQKVLIKANSIFD